MFIRTNQSSIYRIILSISVALFLSGCVSYLPNISAYSSYPTGDITTLSQSGIEKKIDSRLSDCRSQDSSADYACVSLLYGTNRKKTSLEKQFYGNAASENTPSLKLGHITVTIPKDFQTGQDIIQSPDPTRPPKTNYLENYYTISGGKNGPIELSRTEFRTYIQAKMSKLEKTEKQSFIFIHGFRVSFENAAYNTAQLKTDLNIKGPVFFFSWPANGVGAQYLNDQQDADLSGRDLADFIKLVKKSVGEDTSLNIITHSMGHRVVGRAFDIIRLESHSDVKTPIFDNGIFASADIDERLFNDLIIGPKSESALVKNPYIYATDDDRALQLSRFLLFGGCKNNDPKYRVGLVTKRNCKDKKRRVSVFDSPYQTIDVSNAAGEKLIGIFNKNHNKYTKSPRIICQIQMIFRGNNRESSWSNGMSKIRQPNGAFYWKLNKVKRGNQNSNGC